MLKLYVKYYLDECYGNVTTLTIFIESNEILVSEFKKLIEEKISIQSSYQKLTTKIANYILVQMTNSFPLSFFYINQESTIYLELLKDPINLTNKYKTNKTKFRYLTSLGFIKNLSNLKLIPEYQKELIDESMKVTTTSYNEKDINEIIINCVKNENLEQLKELRELYPNFNIDNGYSGKSPLHYACISKNIDLVRTVITFKVDVNKSSIDNWPALHLACHKGNAEVVGLLCSHEGININNNIKQIGTPLHVACRKNNFKIVSILLFYQANYNLRDSNGLLPVDLTSDNLIRKRIIKTVVCKDKVNESEIKLKERPQIYCLREDTNSFPIKPSKVSGMVKKRGKLPFFYLIRFLVIDPVFGSLRRFENQSQYPFNPLETIPLCDIKSCTKIKPWYSNNKYFYFEIVYNSSQVYRVKKEKTCYKWINAINTSIKYSKQIKKIMNNHPKFIENLFCENSGNDLVSIKNNPPKNKVKNKRNENEKEKSQLVCEKYNEEKDLTKNNKENYTNNCNTSLSRGPKLESKFEESETKLIEDDSIEKGISYSSFKFIDQIGEGTFGKVYKVIMLCNKNVYAMKILSKKYLISHKTLKYAVTECNVLKKTSNHPFIINLHYAFQTQYFLYMVLDYCPGGDLSFHLTRELFEENEAKFFIAELILAIEHLHNLDIIYRDLKPENILIDSEGHIKLADFGLAKEKMTGNKLTNSFCGSPAYLSPEMVSKIGVGKSVDIYGIGAVLYEMLTGMPPFYNERLSKLYKNIKKNKVVFPNYVSQDARSLLKKILNKDPKNRLGAKSKEEIKNHPFFYNIDWKKILRKEIKPPINLSEVKIELDNRRKKKNRSVIFEDSEYNEKNCLVNRVKDYTFIK